eukprot:11360512-Prorocentrum_lima.AAC.1
MAGHIARVLHGGPPAARRGGQVHRHLRRRLRGGVPACPGPVRALAGSGRQNEDEGHPPVLPPHQVRGAPLPHALRDRGAQPDSGSQATSLE